MHDGLSRDDVGEPIAALERGYDEAVCAGGALSARHAHEERLDRPLELMAQITQHTPHLALVAVGLANADGAAAEWLTRDARRHLALAIRLAHRALEVHARDVGYELHPWRRSAVVEADIALSTWAVTKGGDERTAAVTDLADASAALAAAIAAVATDRMAVPGHLASALGSWLACYMRAGYADPGRSPREPRRP